MKKPALIIAIIVLLLCALFSGLNILELRAEEPRRAIVALEMLLGDHYIVPEINGWSYYNKPPLFNWVLVGFFKLFNSFDEWVVRLPSIISLCLIGLVNFFVVRKYINKEAGILSSLFFITSADIFFYGSVNAGEIDLFYSLLVFLQVISIYFFYHKRQYLLMFLISYFFAALGVLTKGPPSIAFQGITLLVLLIWYRKFMLLLNWRHFAGIGLFAVITGGYFYLYAQQDDVVAFLVRLFKEASQRTAQGNDLSKTITKALTFPFLLIQLLLPWSLLAIFLIRKDLLKKLRSNPLVLFSALFFMANIPIYWFTAELRNRYIYMFFPFLFIIITYFFQEGIQNKPQLKKWLERIFGVAIAILVIAFIILPFAPAYTEIFNSISFFFWRALIFAFGFVIILLLFIRMKTYRIYVFMLAVILARLAHNFLYLPVVQKESDTLIYRDHISHILEITGNEPVYYTGEPHVFESDASVGPIQFEKVQLTTAPLIPYQIPYYLTRGNGHIMYFEEKIHPGRFYMAPAPFIQNKPVEVFYTFREMWLDQEMVLFRLKPEIRQPG